jgi:SHAQKYF class myb-like DNA-binding protein
MHIQGKKTNPKTKHQNEKQSTLICKQEQITLIKENKPVVFRKIFGLIKDTPIPKPTQSPKFLKKRGRDGKFNTGRWLPEEHKRFIEGLLKFGNEWKSVQKYVGTRSSTQARSHAQKFFEKLGKCENIPFEPSTSSKAFNLLSTQLDKERMGKVLEILTQLDEEKNRNLLEVKDLREKKMYIK